MALSQIDCAPTDQVIQSMLSAMADNLDTEEIFCILRVWIEESEKGSTGGNPGELSRALDSLLGLAL
jgi:L-cysteine:1D-myo-inositol 2-amino-2-deoxy-alpha-D-glucopyranoside ligase